MLAALSFVAILQTADAHGRRLQTGMCSYAKLSRTNMRMDEKSVVSSCTRACAPFGDASCSAKCFAKGGISDYCGKCLGDALNCIVKASPDTENSACKSKCEEGGLPARQCQQCLMETCNQDFLDCANIPLPIDYLLDFHGMCDSDKVRQSITTHRQRYAACGGGKCQGKAKCIAECLKPDVEPQCADAIGDAVHCIYSHSPASGSKYGDCNYACSSGLASDPFCHDCLMDTCNPDFANKTGMTFPYVEFFDFSSSVSDPSGITFPDTAASTGGQQVVEVPSIVDIGGETSVTKAAKGVKVFEDACLAKQGCMDHLHNRDNFYCGVGMTNGVAGECETTNEEVCKKELCPRVVSNLEENAMAINLTGDIGFFCGRIADIVAHCPDQELAGEEISV